MTQLALCWRLGMSLTELQKQPARFVQQALIDMDAEGRAARQTAQWAKRG